jgi:putative ABC transport system permease protein
MIAAAVVVSAMGISLGIRQKLGAELKAYGANVMITPRDGLLDEDVLGRIGGIHGVKDYYGQLYSVVSVNGADVEMIGMELDRIRAQGWRLQGGWPSKAEAVVGTNIRDGLGLKPGDHIALGFGRRQMEVRIAGVVERGGPEDSAVIVDLGFGQALTGLNGSISAVLVRVLTDGIESTVTALRDVLPGADVKPLRQVALAEESFLRKIELLMALVSLVVVAASGISVSSTMSATVLERMKEIGLMMAIGGTRRRIRGFYLAEGVVIGLAGGILGHIVGIAAAQAVSKGAFDSFISVPLYVLPVSMGIGVLLALLSSVLPLADALRNRPSNILRGE